MLLAPILLLKFVDIGSWTIRIYKQDELEAWYTSTLVPEKTPNYSFLGGVILSTKLKSKLEKNSKTDRILAPISDCGRSLTNHSPNSSS